MISPNNFYYRVFWKTQKIGCPKPYTHHLLVYKYVITLCGYNILEKWCDHSTFCMSVLFDYKFSSPSIFIFNKLKLRLSISHSTSLDHYSAALFSAYQIKINCLIDYTRVFKTKNPLTLHDINDAANISFFDDQTASCILYWIHTVNDFPNLSDFQVFHEIVVEDGIFYQLSGSVNFNYDNYSAGQR